MRLAGALEIGVELSLYWPSNNEEEGEDETPGRNSDDN